jgi:hypothetical protein
MIGHHRRKVRRRRDSALSARPSERQTIPMSELERRVQALQSTAVHEVRPRNFSLSFRYPQYYNETKQTVINPEPPRFLRRRPCKYLSGPSCIARS